MVRVLVTHGSRRANSAVVPPANRRPRQCNFASRPKATGDMSGRSDESRCARLNGRVEGIIIRHMLKTTRVLTGVLDQRVSNADNKNHRRLIAVRVDDPCVGCPGGDISTASRGYWGRSNGLVSMRRCSSWGCRAPAGQACRPSLRSAAFGWSRPTRHHGASGRRQTADTSGGMISSRTSCLATRERRCMSPEPSRIKVASTRVSAGHSDSTTRTSTYSRPKAE